MRLWKPLVGVAAVGAIAFGGMRLFGDSNDSQEPGDAPGRTDTVPTDRGSARGGHGPAAPAPGGLRLLRPGSDSFPVLVIGEEDLLIREGWLDPEGRGILEVDTGTTGMTLSDFMPSITGSTPGGDASSTLSAKGAAIDRAAPGDEAKLYSEAQLENIGIGLADTSGVELEHHLGTLLVRGLGQGKSIAALGITSSIAVFRDRSGHSATVVDTVVSKEENGDLRIEGEAELNDLLGFLGSLEEQGRLEAREGVDAVRASGITVEVYGAVGEEKPFVLVPTEVEGVFYVKETSGGPFFEMPPIGGFGSADPKPASTATLIVVSANGGRTFLSVDGREP